MARREFVVVLFILIAAAARAQDPNQPSPSPNDASVAKVSGSALREGVQEQADRNTTLWPAIGAVGAVLGALVMAAALCYRIRHDRAPERMQEAGDEQDYLKQVRLECETIKMLGAGDCPNIAVPTLTTFVSLRISGGWHQEVRVAEEDRAHSSEEALATARGQGRPMVILGDAGSGKTTLLKYYVMSCLTEDRYKSLGFNARPLPIFYPLRQLEPKARTPDSLPMNLERWASKHQLKISAQRFDQWLRRPGTLVLLDGLDEICDPAQRKRVCRWIDSAIGAFGKACFVVTSRRTGYRRSEHISLACKPKPVEVYIEDFTPDQQEKFLQQWFKEAYLARTYTGSAMQPEQWRRRQVEQAMQRAKVINDYLRRPENKAVSELARVPLILQIIAILWKDRTHLPKARSDLYCHALNYLLYGRDAERSIMTDDDEALKPRLSADESIRVLRPACLWMQEKKESDEVSCKEFRSHIRQKLRGIDGTYSPQDYCEWLKTRASLIDDCGEDHYTFRHKSFREYLAGMQLLEVCKRRSKRIQDAAGYFGIDWWEDCMRFFTAEADSETFDGFMRELFAQEALSNPNAKHRELLRFIFNEAKEPGTHALETHLMDSSGAISDAQKECILEDCLRVMGRRKFKAAFSVMLRFAREGEGPPVQTARRILIEERAVEKADVKREVTQRLHEESATSWWNAFELNAEYILVPGGAFTYSVDKQRREVGDVYFAKYTVTNRRYRRFIRYLQGQEGQLEDALPREAFAERLLALARASEVKAFARYLGSDAEVWAEKLGSKYDDDKRFGGADQPVVGVSWYAARAYCLWLSQLEATARGAAPEGRIEYRLPRDLEWEWAASGATRTYPWGDAPPNDKRANYDGNVGATTPVGQYPDGSTPEGLMDMASNVWEWSEDLYDKKRFSGARSLRGGSWNDIDLYLRCSARVNLNPDSRVNYIGFRVVCSQS